MSFNKQTSHLAIVVVMAALLVSANSAHGVVISGVSIDGFSTQYSGREASNLVDGSGLYGNLHGTAVGDMWLTTANDPSPSVTFDLGSVTNVESFRVWNYNEAGGGGGGYKTRSVNNVTIEYGATAALGSTLGAVTNFAQATGAANDPGEVFSGFTPFSARYIKFDVPAGTGVGNHGDTGIYYGLSEVQFNDGTILPPTPEGSIPVANFSFESGTTGWDFNGSGSTYAFGSLLSPVDGTYAAYLENAGYIETDIDLGSVAEGDYTLTVAVGNRSDSIREPGDYRIELIGDGDVLAFAELLDGDTNISNGAMVDLELMFEATAADVGKSLGLRLVHTNGRQGQFDNVRLDFLAAEVVAETVPEPASIAIWSLIGLCLAGYSYRRRRNS